MVLYFYFFKKSDLDDNSNTLHMENINGAFKGYIYGNSGLTWAATVY